MVEDELLLDLNHRENTAFEIYPNYFHHVQQIFIGSFIFSLLLVHVQCKFACKSTVTGFCGFWDFYNVVLKETDYALFLKVDIISRNIRETSVTSFGYVLTPLFLAATFMGWSQQLDSVTASSSAGGGFISSLSCSCAVRAFCYSLLRYNKCLMIWSWVDVKLISVCDVTPTLWHSY